jgi:Flp pilus assembly secretin CpaC
VINLLQLETLPPLMEDKIRQAIQGVGGGRVTVRRVLRGAVRDDAQDTFVLEGPVPNQVALVRILSVASQIVAGRRFEEEDIQVVADEAGALSGRNQDLQQQGGQQFGLSGSRGLSSLLGGGSGGGRNMRLTNQIRRNLGRAKVIEAADGRLLSFLEVGDLPQVRVDVRFYEVNRTKLRTYSPSTVMLASDFRQPAFSPAGAAEVVQGQPTRVGGRLAVQNILSFLGGTLSNQVQFTAGRFAIDSAFSLLERESIARSLSSPSLSVLSGEQAIFQVGGEIPIPEAFAPVFGGNQGAIPAGVFSSVIFEPFGIQLSIRPLVGDDDTITVDLIPQVVTPNTDLTASIRQSTGTNLLTTAFQTRALRTSGRLQDGQALLLGGLLTRNTRDTRAGTPGLRDVPGVGWLFREFERSDEGLELVVVVNPVILRDPNPEVPLWQFPGTEELIREAKPQAK